MTVLRASECLYQTVFHRSDLDFLRFQSLSAHTESASPLKKLSQRGNKDRAIKRCSQKKRLNNAANVAAARLRFQNYPQVFH